MKKILLVGYTRKNVGDDLFLSMMIHRYKDYNIEIFCPKKFSTPFLNAKNVKVIDDDFFESKKINIDNYSMCLYVGGSIFKESPKDIRMKKWLMDFVLKCKEKDIPFYFISSNFGPYQSKEYFDLCSNLIKNTSGINFREKYSKDLFKIKKCKYVPDLVLSMNYKKKSTIKGSVGISIINLYGLPRGEIDKSYFEYMYFLKNNIEKYIDSGKKVYLYSFCEHERDEMAIDTLLSFIDSAYWKNIKVVNYNGDLKAFLDMYSRMEYVLCTRFHAMILSALFNQKIIVCNYSKKISNVIKDYGFECKYLEINKDIRDIIVPLDEYKECKNVEKIISISNDNYLDIDESVNKVYQTNNVFNNDFESFYKKNNKIRKLGGKVLRKAGILKKKKKKKVVIDINESNKKILDDCLEKNIIDDSVYNNCLKALGLEYKSISNKPITKGELVSFIIPSYKRNNYVTECIDSIINQTYKNIEIIVIDDYVESDLKGILDKKYKGINIIYSKNKVNSKAGKSRQNGYNLAKGKYIVYCDDDDFYVDDRFVEKSINKFEENDSINLVGFNSFNYIEENKAIKFKRVGYSGLCNCLDYITSFQIEYYKPCPSFAMFRKSILDKNNFKQMAMMNDSAIFLNAMKDGLMYIFNDPVGFYREHADNITLNLSPQFIIENMEEKKEIYHYLKDNNLISNPDYWWYLQNKITMDYFIKGSKPNFKKFNILFKWCLNNMDKYKGKFYKEMLKKQIKSKI